MATSSAVRSRPGKLHPPSSMEIEELAPLQDNSKQQRQQPCLPASVSAISYALDMYSHPLVLQSTTAFNALLIIPLVIWWSAVVAGMWVYEGLPKEQKVYHSLLWFDRGILRPAGPLLPFAVLILRAVIHGADYVYRHGLLNSVAAARVAVSSAAGTAAGKQPGLKLGSLFGWCLVIYVAMAVARVGIYLTHWFLLTNRFLEYHIVSDHIFLAASMLICLHTEITCLMSDVIRAVVHRQPNPPLRNSRAAAAAAAAAGIPGLDILLTLLFVVALFLYLFTAADMYYTARYYHFPMESFFTTVLVFVVFQLPMLLWLKTSWRFSAEE